MSLSVYPRSLIIIYFLVFASCEGGPLSRYESNSTSSSGDWQICQKNRPKVCSMIYQPVCGLRSDGAVVKYSSSCNACADITVAAWRPDFCEDSYDSN